MTPVHLQELYERKARAMMRRPSFARASGFARVRLTDGVACEVEHPDRSLHVDLPPEDGGGGTGPHPGQLMRASLGACLAMGYRVWGVRLEVAIDAIEIDVICEYDVRGQMGLADDVAVGWQRILFDVRITSRAAEEEVRRLVAHANRLSPMLANLSPAVAQVHRLAVVRPGAPGARGESP